MNWLSEPQIWASLVTLSALEIVLGIDNLIFLSIVAARLPEARRERARRIGVGLALLLRLALLAMLAWIIRLTAPLFIIGGHDFSWRDLILIGGGLFLLYKGTGEIHDRIEHGDEPAESARQPARMSTTIAQIALLDVVFSLDSIITAIGMASHLPVMMAAVAIAALVMLLAAGPVAAFVNRHPTVKMLALSFLLLIGMTLVADGFDVHVPRTYIYAAIGFSAFVELLNQLASRRRASRGRTRPAGGD
jgi:predicted tellurium resistance membrane protein TerC